MNILRSLIMAFSMFSKLPMPQIEWKEQNMRHMLNALPLVGAVIGLVAFAWFWLCNKLDIGTVLFGAGVAALPIFISGGIHMDGLMDVCDALASHASKEKKRAILKDSHAGAFAVLGCGVYVLMYFAFATELDRSIKTALLLGLIYMASRAGGAFLSIVMGGANEGLLQCFKAASSKTAAYVGGLWLVLVGAGFILCCGVWCGGAMMIAEALCLICCGHMAKKQFGGISGDIAGFTIQSGELIMLSAYIITQKAVALWC